MALIYIVEDDESIREVELFALKNGGHTVCDFENATDFYVKLERKQPDLVVLDIMLPDEDGYSVIKKLRSGHATKKLPVILVTAKTAEMDMIRGLDMGADDYIKKPFSVIELMTRVKALLRRTLDEECIEKRIAIGEISLDDERHTVYVDNEPVELTFKEFELLKFLMIHTGIVMTRDSIMRNVWGAEFELESRTVDMHIKTLRQKLKEGGERIRTVRNVGYVME